MDMQVRIIEGDCIAIMQELAMQGVKVDMILVDPPYGTTNCRWDSVISFEEMWSCIKGITTPSTPILIFGAEPYSSKLRCSNIKQYKYDWIWEKTQATGHLNAKRAPMRAYENISVFYGSQPTYNPIKTFGHKRKVSTAIHKRNSKKGGAYNDYDVSDYDSTERYPRNVLKYSTDKQKCNLHPTQKPVALLEYLIKTYTNERDVVLDFTMGSGSTGVACVNTNRRFIGIELNDFDIALKRLHTVQYQEQNRTHISRTE